MTTRIDELNSRYLVPGVDLDTAASAELEGFEEDFGEAPYSQLPPLMDIPSPTGWQDLLGLNQAAPSPSQIDPPPRPISYLRLGAANRLTTSLQVQTSFASSHAFATPKVERMKAMLSGYNQTVRRIYARASRGGRG